MKFLDVKNTNKQIGFLLVAMSVVVLASSNSARSDVNIELPELTTAVETGVQSLEVLTRIYKDLNPPQEGYVTVLNTLDEIVTVRSYGNNNKWKLIASGQITLNPGGSANITAATDPVILIWKIGNYGALKPFGTRNLSQNAVSKSVETVFVIGEGNTIR